MIHGECQNATVRGGHLGGKQNNDKKLNPLISVTVLQEKVNFFSVSIKHLIVGDGMQTSTCRHPASLYLVVGYFQAERGREPLPLLSDRHSVWVEEAKLKPAEVDFPVFLDNWCKGEKGAVLCTAINIRCYCNSSSNAIQIQSQQKIECCTESETEQCWVLKKVISPRDPVVSHFPCGTHREVGQYFPQASKVNLQKVQSQFINQF